MTVNETLKLLLEVNSNFSNGKDSNLLQSLLHGPPHPPLIRYIVETLLVEVARIRKEVSFLLVNNTSSTISININFKARSHIYLQQLLCSSMNQVYPTWINGMSLWYFPKVHCGLHVDTQVWVCIKVSLFIDQTPQIWLKVLASLHHDFHFSCV